jgi:hypothetical protein
MTAPVLAIPGARRGTCLDDRCVPLLPGDPDERHGRMCWDCGRGTTRRETDGSWRCLGALPTFTACGHCRWPMTFAAAGQALHPACEPKARRRIAITRGLERIGLGHCTCVDVAKPGGCPHCKEFAVRLRGAR